MIKIILIKRNIFVSVYLILYLDLKGCSGISQSICQVIDGIIIEELEGVENTADCQFICNTKYSETCKYFVYDTKMLECKMFDTVGIDFCGRIAAGTTTNLEECALVFESEYEESSCLVRDDNTLIETEI